MVAVEAHKNKIGNDGGLLVSYASALARFRVFAIPGHQRTTSGRVSEVSGVWPFLLSLLDLALVFGVPQLCTRVRLKQQRRAVGIGLNPNGDAGYKRYF